MSETREHLEEARAVMRDMADGPGVPLSLVAGKRPSFLAEALAEAEAVVCAVCACFNWRGYEAVDLGVAGWHHPKCPKRPRLERERDAAAEEGDA